MNGNILPLVPLALLALIGFWLVMSPVAFISWFKSARRDLRDKPSFTDDNPAAISFVKFLGIFLIVVVAVALVAFVLPIKAINRQSALHWLQIYFPL